MLNAGNYLKTVHTASCNYYPDHVRNSSYSKTSTLCYWNLHFPDHTRSFIWTYLNSHMNNFKYYLIVCLFKFKFFLTFHFTFQALINETYQILHLQHSILEKSKKHQ